MSFPCNPHVGKTFPKHFWLGLGMAAFIWTILGLGTTIG